MLAIIFDIGGAFLVSKFVRNIWIALLAAVLGGAVEFFIAF